jgi:hypothetical protein
MVILFRLDFDIVDSSLSVAGVYSPAIERGSSGHNIEPWANNLGKEAL